MRDSSALFALYIPVYIYVLLVIYLTVYLIMGTIKNSSPTFTNLLSTNATWLHNFTFLSVMLSMLGTPPTLGFFGKVLTFYLLSQGGLLAVFIPLALTLVLIVFYLQTVRAKAYPRKQVTFGRNRLQLGGVIFLIYGQLLLLSFSTILVPLFDIFISLTL